MGSAEDYTNKEFYDSYSWPIIIQVIKSRKN